MKAKLNFGAAEVLEYSCIMTKKFAGFRGPFSKFLRWNKLRSRLEKAPPFTKEENWTFGTQGRQKKKTVKKGQHREIKL